MPLADFHPHYLTLQQQGDVVVVAFSRTRLTDDENIELLGRELFSLVEQYGCRSIVVSMHDVTFVTSAVLGKLITLHRKLHRSSGRLVICDIMGNVATVLRSSRLITYFNTADGVDEAVAQLN